MVKKFRPTSPGRRKLVLPEGKQLTRLGRKKVKPTKALLKPKTKTNGRNHHGRVTCRHRGGGHKRFIRVIDFKRAKDGIPAKVASIEYDPNRSAFIALLNYADGEKTYIIAPEGIKAGDQLMSGKTAPFEPGNAMMLSDMPIGSTIHNIELYPTRGGVLVRSAGMSAQLMAREGGYATLKMPSGETRMVRETCRATFGVVSNSEWSLRVDGKAGRTRWRGFRPTVRGTAMNPVDHPHGGGEGRQNGYIPQTPWAQQTKGKKTRSRGKSRKLIVKDRRKKK
ncbi:MAG: 50S ribosomal protein L2 [Simkaniaceae bacterium]|nr:50S ribosomal protein L2 [Simkaniaceae bacterium]